MMPSSQPPKKYVKINGVMKLNPDYKAWQEAQARATGGPTAAPATTVARPDAALPVVSSMEDYARLNEDLGTETPLAEATSAAIEMMQEPEICVAAGSEYITMRGRSLCIVCGSYGLAHSSTSCFPLRQ